MLTIGEISDLSGSTVRAVRHYHARGLLPEPARQSNGYRSYGPHDLVRLVKIRRLQEVGLSLAEVADVLTAAGDGELDLRHVLVRLDAQLAAEQDAITRRRDRISELLAGSADPTLPPELAALLARFSDQGLDEAHLAKERDALALLVALAPDRTADLVAMYEALLIDGGATVVALTARFVALERADVADPEVEEVARLFADFVLSAPDFAVPEVDGVPSPSELVSAFIIGRLEPAQRRCIDLITERLTKP